MRTLRLIRNTAVALATVGMLIPCPGAWAAERPVGPRLARSVVADVGLKPGGQLTGVVRSASGAVSAGCPITLIPRATGERQTTTTDESGRFTVSGLTAGLYQIDTPNGATVCRCWAESTAPPSAAAELLVIDDQLIQRGQKPLAEALFSTPTLVVLMIAAAIAIPIAVHNAQDDAS